MRRAGLLLLLAVPMLVLAGGDPLNLLPYAREIDSMVLMRTMGVDGGGAEVSVTLSSGAGEGEEPELLTARESSVSGAVLALQGMGEHAVFYGHVDQLLLGEELAAARLREPLDYVLRDVEMRLDTGLYVVRDGMAEGAIRGAAGPGRSAAGRLQALSEDVGLLADTVPRMVGQVLADLEEQGAAFAPALRAESGSLVTAGYAIWKGDTLAGWAEGEAARGVNLYLGEVDADILKVNGAALRVVQAKSRVRPIFEGNRLTAVEVCCRVEANLAEAPPGLDPAIRSRLEALERALEETEAARLAVALETAQRLDADYLGLRRGAMLAAPWRKAELQRQWSLRDLELRVVVEGRVERGYDVVR